jgi:hypothetical protein
MPLIRSGRGALPYTILVEPGGKVVWKSMGTVNFTELETSYC